MTEEKKVYMYNGCIFGVIPSEEALREGYMDYATLAQIIERRVRCNNITMHWDEFELWSGCEEDEETGEYREIFQFYIVDQQGAEFVMEYTNDPLYYSESLDMWVWGITHFGTPWSAVLTPAKIIKRGE